MKEFSLGFKKGVLFGLLLITLAASFALGARAGSALRDSVMKGGLFGGVPASVASQHPRQDAKVQELTAHEKHAKPVSISNDSSTTSASPPPPPVSRNFKRKVRSEAEIVKELASQIRQEVKASLKAIRAELASENRRLKKKVERLERRTRALEVKFARLAAKKRKAKKIARRSSLNAFPLSRNAKILATIQMEGEWMALLQLSTGDRRRVRVGSKVGDLRVKDIAPRKVILGTATGQDIVLTISGV